MLCQLFSDDGDILIRDSREHLLHLSLRGLYFGLFPFCESDILTWENKASIKGTPGYFEERHTIYCLCLAPKKIYAVQGIR